jgi:hypothetical protein
VAGAGGDHNSSDSAPPLPLAGGEEEESLSPQFLDELRARTLLSSLIGRTTKLQKAGREFRACCPFHNEKSLTRPCQSLQSKRLINNNITSWAIPSRAHSL